VDASIIPSTTQKPPRWATSTYPLVGQLNREWTTLRADTAANAIAASWARETPALAGLRTLAQLEEAAARLTDLAARVVLQLMLGKVVLIARAHASVLPELDERVQLAVTCMYEAIRTFPVERRRHHVPPHLAWSTHAAVGRAVRAQAVEVPVGSLTEVVWQSAGLHPSEELAQVLAWAVAAGHLSRTDAELLAARYGFEEGANRTWKGMGDLEAVAQRRGLSPASVKQRCSRARRRLAAVAPDYLDLSDGESEPGEREFVAIYRCTGLPPR